jgi:protein involved in polysaccharide export with SLBB domain
MKLDSYRQFELRLVLGLCLLAFSTGCTSLLSPISAVPASRLPPELLATPRANLQPIDLARLRQLPPEEYRLAPGDVLGVYVEGALGAQDSPAPVHYPMAGSDVKPAFGYPVPVRDDGTISLPLVTPIPVEGLTVAEVEKKVRDVYLVEQKILREGQDRTAVSLVRKRTSRVIVVREDGNQEIALPGGRAGRIQSGSAEIGRGFVVDLPAYENDVMHALAQTGGLPGLNARNEVKIWRRRPTDWSDRDHLVREFHAAHAGERCQCPPAPPDDDSVVRIPLRLPPGETPQFRPEDIVLHEGDIVYVESRDAEVFYTGGLLPPGQFPLPRDYDLDVLGAIAVAGKGLGSNPGGGMIGGLGGASPSKLYVIRRIPDGSQITIAVDLDRAIMNPRERILIHSGDTLILRHTPAEETTNFALFAFFTYGVQQLFSN